MARDAFADFERFELKFVEVDDFASLAEAAFHQEAGEGFIGFARRREVDVPEFGARVEEMDGVEVTVGFVVDFGDDAGASGLPLIGFELAAEVEFLASGDAFGETEDAAVAADEQSFSRLRNGSAGAGDPRCLDGHAEAHAVTLSQAIGFHKHNLGEREKS
jgi:hypothetical protein